MGEDATEAARALAEGRGIDLAEVEGTGEDGRILLGDVQAYIEGRGTGDVPADEPAATTGGGFETPAMDRAKREPTQHETEVRYLRQERDKLETKYVKGRIDINWARTAMRILDQAIGLATRL